MKDSLYKNKEWLYEKYIIQKLTMKQIGIIANCDDKTVYYWLKKYEIPTRSRADSIKENSYIKLVAAGLAKHPWLGKHRSDEDKRKSSEKQKGKPRNHHGKNNPMFGKKGESHPNWKGGVTPERGEVTNSLEWKSVQQLVYIRDEKTCQRCGHKSNGKCIKRGKRNVVDMCIHHIVPFYESEKLRCDLNNLILLCLDCHYWVHSNKNTNKEYIQ